MNISWIHALHQTDGFSPSMCQVLHSELLGHVELAEVEFLEDQRRDPGLSGDFLGILDRKGGLNLTKHVGFFTDLDI